MAANTPMTKRPIPTCSGVCARLVAIDATPMPDEEHDHHAVAAPAVGQPACGQGEQAEGEESRRRVDQQLRIADAPLAVQRQSGDRCEDQREQMIQEMPEVEQQEVGAIACHR